MNLTGIGTFLIVLGVLVLFHEFGHFIVARFCGVQVLTFSLGFGPKIISRKWGATEYCISSVPLGGYVRLLGDDPNEPVAPELKDQSFLEKGFLKKAAIVLAGPAFNLILALLIFVGVFIHGVPSPTSDVGEVQAGSAAEKGGLKPSDKIVEIESAPILHWEEIREAIQKQGGRSLHVTVERAGSRVALQMTPTHLETTDLLGDPLSLWVIGVSPKGTYTTQKYGLFKATYMGAARTWEMMVLNMKGIVRMITGKISSDNIGGPILIAQMAGKQAAEGVMSVLLFMAVISINLGIINLFPIPILDGGHLLFFIIEAIIGRPLSLKTREVTQQIGLALIVSLMVFAFYNDIMRIFVKPS